MSGKDQRKSIRTKLRASVKLKHSATEDHDLHTGDISDSGAYIVSGGKSLPHIGEIVSVQVQGLEGGDAPILKMRIVRTDKKGIGLEFVKEDS